MRFFRRSLMGLFLLAVTLGLLSYAGSAVYSALVSVWSEEQPDRPARERVFAVYVDIVTLRDVVPVLTTFGEVRSRRTLDIRAKSSGTITMLREGFEEGGRVTAGQLLVQIDPADAQSALDVAKTDLQEAEAELRDAEQVLALARADVAAAEEQARLRAQALERQKGLQQRGFGTDAAVEVAELAAASARQSVLSRRQALANAERRIDQARTQLARVRINLSEAERRLQDTSIHAGFTGTLSNVNVVEGGLVSKNEQIAQLIDPDDLEVSFRVSTPQYKRLLDGSGALIPSEVTVRLDAYGADLVAKGKITRESAAVSKGQTGRLLFAKLDAARGFRPGDFVTVEVAEPELKAVAVLPATAVDANETVLVVGDDDRLKSAPVRLLRRQGDDVIVSAPELEGMRVVAERSPLLGAGIKVRPIAPEAASAMPEEPEFVQLSPERRAALIAFVEGNRFMPDEVRQRVLTQLAQDKVPARMIARIESRMGG